MGRRQLRQRMLRQQQRRRRQLPTKMNQQDVEAFAALLEKAGYSGALKLIEENLLPLAREQKISLWHAADGYADPDQDQDTSYFQLFDAILQIDLSAVKSINIHEPL